MQGYSLWISFKTEMMIVRSINGLKGQLILAQGKRSVALGWKMSVKIVRAIMFFERLSLLRTKRYVSQFPACGWQASKTRLLPWLLLSPRLTSLGGQGGRVFNCHFFPRRCRSTELTSKSGAIRQLADGLSGWRKWVMQYLYFRCVCPERISWFFLRHKYLFCGYAASTSKS